VQALRELSSPGKSGALFYISHDDRFLIKTMRKNEMQTFLRMLPAYFTHAQNNPHMLLTKFYGLHRIQMNGRKGRKARP
jgi:1-phosphatidylinositol-4-phosphate 5-kinase